MLAAGLWVWDLAYTSRSVSKFISSLERSLNIILHILHLGTKTLIIKHFKRFNKYVPNISVFDTDTDLEDIF